MHTPTVAERKIILAKLPKPPTGKVWKRYVGDQKVKAGGTIVTFNTANQTTGFIGSITEGCWFTTQKASGLRNWESAWRLVAARKRPAKTIYYRPSEGHPVGGDTNRWTAKLSEYADHVYRPNGDYASNGSKESFGWAKGARGNIKSGVYTTITRAEFLSRIKGYGLNEDGTKIVAPPTVHYYRPKVSTPHWAVKNDGTTYFEYNNNDFRDGYVQKPVAESAMYMVKEGLERGTDIEIDRNEFLGLIKSFGLNEDGTKIAPPKTELERLREELAATEAELSQLATKYRDLRTKVEKARVVLS